MKNPELIIRDARPEELDQVALILKESYQEYAKNLSPERFKAYVEDMMDVRSRLPESKLIVAELDGQLVGTVTLYLRSSVEQVWPKGWAGVRLLGVLPAYRGQGVGRALMDECVRRAKQARLSAVGLHTTEAMATAKKMYERMGFVRAPEYDFHPGPNTIVMAYGLKL